MTSTLGDTLLLGDWKGTLFALVAIVLTIVGLWVTHRPAETREVKWEDVRAEAKEGDYQLIGTSGLNDLYEADPGGILIVDTRQEWEFGTGHIKGAINFPMEPTWWSRLRSRAALEKALGPDRNRTVVFY
jgi:3-mercaptopyruvate sulfurtransferase SseA